MTASNKSIHRATVFLDVPAKIADVILHAKSIVQKMTKSPIFSTSTPAVPALNAALSVQLEDVVAVGM